MHAQRRTEMEAEGARAEIERALLQYLRSPQTLRGTRACAARAEHPYPHSTHYPHTTLTLPSQRPHSTLTVPFLSSKVPVQQCDLAASDKGRT